MSHLYDSDYLATTGASPVLQYAITPPPPPTAQLPRPFLLIYRLHINKYRSNFSEVDVAPAKKKEKLQS